VCFFNESRSGYGGGVDLEPDIALVYIATRAEVQPKIKHFVDLIGSRPKLQLKHLKAIRNAYK